MNELAAIQNYGQFKEALGTELRNQAEGFVRTGYLLKVARDTDILKESGYTTVAEFAQAEYGLTKDIVSRYIAINDRYSKDGYSEYLQERFEGYGVAKLQEMLTLPIEVIELTYPEMTKREIQDIKKEVKEEEKISDVEVCLEREAPDQEHMTIIQKAIHNYFYEQREQYIRLEDVIKAQVDMAAAVEKVLDVLTPSGMALKTVRVQGVGKLMLSFKGRENDIEMLNVRNNEKETFTWQQFIENMVSTFGGKAGVHEWEMIYGEPFAEPEPPKEEKKPAVAPVQPKTVSPTAESVPKQPESVPGLKDGVREHEEKSPNPENEAIEEDIQVPAQTNIEDDVPVHMPEPEKEVVDVEAEVVENVENTKCEGLSEHPEKMPDFGTDMALREETFEKAMLVADCIKDWKDAEEMPVPEINK